MPHGNVLLTNRQSELLSDLVLARERERLHGLDEAVLTFERDTVRCGHGRAATMLLPYCHPEIVRNPRMRSRVQNFAFLCMPVKR